MSVKLIKSPPKGWEPGMPERPYCVSTKINVDCKAKYRADLETTLAIEQTLGKIWGTLRAFSAIHVEGKITVVILPISCTITGELKTYPAAMARRHPEYLLRAIDTLTFSFSREFAPKLQEVTFTMKQTCDFTYRDP